MIAQEEKPQALPAFPSLQTPARDTLSCTTESVPVKWVHLQCLPHGLWEALSSDLGMWSTRTKWTFGIIGEPTF